MGHKVLVIHPRDESTRFLELTYRSIDATVLTGHTTRDRLSALLEKFDQIIMLGHGSPHGLFSVGQFPSGAYVVDKTFVDQLRERDNNVFIWCYAANFAADHRLLGFATGMFISEAREAEWFNLTTTEAQIEDSNRLFARVVGQFVTEPPRILHSAVDEAYGALANVNSVAEYNHARLRLFEQDRAGDQVLLPHEQCVLSPVEADAGIRQTSLGVQT